MKIFCTHDCPFHRPDKLTVIEYVKKVNEDNILFFSCTVCGALTSFRACTEDQARKYYKQATKKI